MTEHMSAAEFLKQYGGKQPTTTKYRNQKTTIDGIEFDSKLEAGRYSELKLMLKAGLIRSFNIQPSFVLQSGIRYRADFIVWGLDGIPWVEDTKGVRTKEFNLKEKLWKDSYPDMELRILK